MEEKTIRMLCNSKWMIDSDLFVKFFMKRFPNESDDIHSYCNEWIDRFLTGTPINYMDIQSKDIYLKICGIMGK